MTPKMLSDAVMRLVDLLAMNPAETREIDPRSWDRLRIYMPNDPYAEAIETIGERMREALQRCLDHFEKISGHKDPSAMMIQAQDALRAWQRKPKTVLEISTAPPSANTEALLRKLSDAADEVLAPLGCHGTISARDDRVMALMDVMYEADKVLGKNGERPKPVPEIRAVRCACPETNGVLVCRAPAGAPGCRFDTVYNGNEKGQTDHGARDCPECFVKSAKPTENGIGNVRMVPVPSMLIARLIDMHQDAADALVDIHGDPHRQMVEELTALLNGPSLSNIQRAIEHLEVALPLIPDSGVCDVRAALQWLKAGTSLGNVPLLVERVKATARRFVNGEPCWCHHPINTGHKPNCADLRASLRAIEAMAVTSQSQSGEQA